MKRRMNRRTTNQSKQSNSNNLEHGLTIEQLIQRTQKIKQGENSHLYESGNWDIQQLEFPESLLKQIEEQNQKIKEASKQKQNKDIQTLMVSRVGSPKTKQKSRNINGQPSISTMRQSFQKSGTSLNEKTSIGRIILQKQIETQVTNFQQSPHAQLIVLPSHKQRKTGKI